MHTILSQKISVELSYGNLLAAWHFGVHYLIWSLQQNCVKKQTGVVCLYFPDEETEGQKEQIICPRSRR